MNRAVAVARLRFVFVCVGLLALAGEARADWAVVTVGSDAPPGDATVKLVRDRAEARLRAAKFQTLDRDSAVQEGVTDEAVRKCVQKGQECLQDVLSVTTVDRLVHIELVSVSPGYRLTARLYDGIGGGLLRTEERACSECANRDALGRAVEDLVGKLLGDKPAVTGPDTWLDISTDPPGARVKIDGKEVGPSGRAYSVSAGEHTVRVELDGYDAAEKQVSATADATTKVAITLSKHVDTPPEPMRFGAWKWVALGTGAGLTAIGIYGFAIDGNSRYDDNGARLPEKWETTRRASIYTSLGVISLGLSAYFIYHDATLPESGAPLPDANAEQQHGLTLHRMDDGWGIGLAGSF